MPWTRILGTDSPVDRAFLKFCRTLFLSSSQMPFAKILITMGVINQPQNFSLFLLMTMKTEDHRLEWGNEKSSEGPFLKLWQLRKKVVCARKESWCKCRSGITGYPPKGDSNSKHEVTSFIIPKPCLSATHTCLSLGLRFSKATYFCLIQAKLSFVMQYCLSWKGTVTAHLCYKEGDWDKVAGPKSQGWGTALAPHAQAHPPPQLLTRPPCSGPTLGPWPSTLFLNTV